MLQPRGPHRPGLFLNSSLSPVLHEFAFGFRLGTSSDVFALSEAELRSRFWLDTAFASLRVAVVGKVTYKRAGAPPRSCPPRPALAAEPGGPGVRAPSGRLGVGRPGPRAPSLALTLAPTSGSRPSEGPRVRVAASEGRTVSVSVTQPSLGETWRRRRWSGQGCVRTVLGWAGPHRLHLSLQETVLVRCSRPGHHSIHKTFTFERVYGPAEGQAAVFADVCPLLTSLLDGYNVCIMAYGQTGSGKTYTMLGPQPPGAAQGDAGLIPRAAQELFRLMSEDPSERPRVEVSILEVYNNDIFDLLATDGCAATAGLRREVLTTREGRTEVSPLTCLSVGSAGELVELVGAGLQLRARRATSVHADSSRSHLVVTVTLTAATSGDSTPESRSSPSLPQAPGCPSPSPPATGRRPPAPRRASPGSPEARPAGQVRARLQLVDLAGSEGADLQRALHPHCPRAVGE
ncbi:Kinesin-like protein KIF25 [Myotis davidii]|uniref:Kinesin-like protein n=1 Tax=Myotis davidii TaxID=225400 RepID=L5MDC8_MYODS|nr:Kinesin-like protein KIF25 [Myotis davidii]